MKFLSTSVAFFLLAVDGTSAFSRPAFIQNAGVCTEVAKNHNNHRRQHRAGGSCSAKCNSKCSCPACVGAHNKKTTALFSIEASSEVEVEASEAIPSEVEALDGIESSDEAHNADRPARSNLQKKKKPQGKSLDEFEIGSTVSAKVKTITSYGAFLDVGAETDGLLHISQLSKDFVSDVNEFLEINQEVEVRIANIDKKKGQIALSLLTEEEAAQGAPQRRGGGGGNRGGNDGGNRRDDNAALSSLVEKGWDTEKFIEGTVVNTVDFGAFVRINVADLNEEASGEMDGLVHISSLAAGRVNSVTEVVNANDKVQVRVKSIMGKKVSLSMISSEDESSGRAPAAESYGAADWKESLEKLQADMPKFNNKPMVVDTRK